MTQASPGELGPGDPRRVLAVVRIGAGVELAVLGEVLRLLKATA